MTIRRALRAWFRFLWIGLLTVGVLAGSWRPHSWTTYYLRMAALGSLAVSIMGLFAYGFACPRCRRSMIRQSPAVFDGRSCACAGCGVSVDEPSRPARTDVP